MPPEGRRRWLFTDKQQSPLVSALKLWALQSTLLIPSKSQQMPTKQQQYIQFWGKKTPQKQLNNKHLHLRKVVKSDLIFKDTPFVRTNTKLADNPNDRLHLDGQGAFVGSSHALFTQRKWWRMGDKVRVLSQLLLERTLMGQATDTPSSLCHHEGTWTWPGWCHPQGRNVVFWVLSINPVLITVLQPNF